MGFAADFTCTHFTVRMNTVVAYAFNYSWEASTSNDQSTLIFSLLISLSYCQISAPAHWNFLNGSPKPAVA